MLKIYNTLNKKIEEFTPINNNKVNMYVCGPTVYGDIHIGNARPVIFFDFVKRYLKHLNYDVFYASNITDVDDRIVEKAIQTKRSELEVSSEYTEKFKNMTKAIGSEFPDLMPKATEYIDAMTVYIQNLIDRGYAYKTESGVYFRVSKISDYGLLSGQNINELNESVRIVNQDDKESSKDFALWKTVSEGIEFNSPFGKGRPGWHTECAVMNHDIFNGEIDIHGGGTDLIFPHHENEIAQSVAHDHHHLSKYWMHVARLDINHTKMSKSLGNTILVKDLIEQVKPKAFRLLILGHHYRQPINYTEELLNEYVKQYEKIEQTLKKTALKLRMFSNVSYDRDIISNFENILNDDFNTPNVITLIQDLIKQLNKETELSALEIKYHTLSYILDILGVMPEYRLTDDIIKTFDLWQIARNEKNFAKADIYRNELLKEGWI